MTPLSEDLLNPPERILDELRKAKEKMTQLKILESMLKDELEQHRENGRIKGIFKSNGVTANRLQTKQKYQFSEELTRQEEAYKTEIDQRKELEILDNKAVKLETTSYWRITVDK
jgi:ferric-dicitrate binding protein FerR (iron transport regulator)